MAYYLFKKLRENQRRNAEEPESTSPCGNKEEERAIRVYRWRLIAGLFFPAVVEGLNTTMIAAAVPFIASDFGMFATPRTILGCCATG